MKLRPKYIASNNTLNAGKTIEVAAGDVFTYVDVNLNTYSVNQITHGFAVGKILYFNGADYLLASTNSEVTAGRFIVTSVTDVNNFDIAFHGEVTITDATLAVNLIVGTIYYLSKLNDGDVLASDVGANISNPIYKVLNINGNDITLNLLSFRPSAGKYSFQGSNYGTTASGQGSNSQYTSKFSFTIEGDTTFILSNPIIHTGDTTGQFSRTHAYISGGKTPYDGISKFSFTNNNTANAVGILTIGGEMAAGNSSVDCGYHIGGVTTINIDRIDRFPFSTDSNAITVGNLILGRYSMTSQTSIVASYVTAGFDSTYTNSIDKFLFTNESIISYVGNINGTRIYASAHSSTDNGYLAGGAAGVSDKIEKFSFATNNNSIITGNLISSIQRHSGHSSLNYGYLSCDNVVTSIYKFSFSTDGNATVYAGIFSEGPRNEAATAQY